MGSDETGAAGDEDSQFASAAKSYQFLRIPEQVARDRFAAFDALAHEAPRFTEPREIVHGVRDPERGQARLPRAEEVARSARLQVLLGDDETVRRLLEHLEPSARVGRRVRADDEGAPRRPSRAPDPAPKLVELREAEALGV